MIGVYCITYGNERRHVADFVSWTSDIGKFGYLKFSAQSMATWLFLFSLNTFETEKDQVIAFATTLPVLTLLFLCFTHNLQVKIEFWFKVKSFILIHTLSTTFVENYGLLNFTLYWQTVYFHFHFCGRVRRGFIWFDFWGFWLGVLCGNWEEVELAIYNLFFQSKTFLWCRALIEIKSCSL